MKNYLQRHLQVLIGSSGTLLRTPGATAMTISVIGITLALPVILYLLVSNIQTLTHDWEGRAQLTLYLKPGLSALEQEAFVGRLRSRPEFSRVEYLNADQALAEFKQEASFAEALGALDHNPLPATVILYLSPGHSEDKIIENLARQFQQEREVDLARSDTAWVKRLHAGLKLLQRGVWLIAALLAFAVIVTISNTIRLHILNRRDEIEIIKLVGGSNAFIRRPFLYTGLLQGLAGAVMAVLLVIACIITLNGPAQRLTVLYATEFQIHGLNVSLVMAVLAAGAGLGWLASRWAVQRHLARFEPK